VARDVEGETTDSAMTTRSGCEETTRAFWLRDATSGVRGDEAGAGGAEEDPIGRGKRLNESGGKVLETRRNTGMEGSDSLEMVGSGAQRRRLSLLLTGTSLMEDDEEEGDKHRTDSWEGLTRVHRKDSIGSRASPWLKEVGSMGTLTNESDIVTEAKFTKDELDAKGLNIEPESFSERSCSSVFRVNVGIDA
jgi:hypothetical protein